MAVSRLRCFQGQSLSSFLGPGFKTPAPFEVLVASFGPVGSGVVVMAFWSGGVSCVREGGSETDQGSGRIGAPGFFPLHGAVGWVHGGQPVDLFGRDDQRSAFLDIGRAFVFGSIAFIHQPEVSPSLGGVTGAVFFELLL